MAPEIYEESEDVSKASIWTLGVFILHFMRDKSDAKTIYRSKQVSKIKKLLKDIFTDKKDKVFLKTL